MTFFTKRFDELSNSEIHEIFRLRSEVFVVEQNCVYQDIDGKDPVALHCYIQLENGDITAYTRIFDKGDYHSDKTSIGRVIVNPKYRRAGYGIQIMNYSIEQCEELFGKVSIEIGAQQYLRKFYNDLGFEETGHDYLEDGIPHTTLIFPADGFEKRTKA
ncbi:ElaA protein [Spirosomataceae bacterium TFI 002]|nr:ElaA protein [Spirosomataceae bacterium TFI 002]